MATDPEVNLARKGEPETELKAPLPLIYAETVELTGP
jgi:hypothetical protein